MFLIKMQSNTTSRLDQREQKLHIDWGRGIRKDVRKFLDIDESVNLTDQPKGAYRIPKNKISGSLLGNSTFRKVATKLIPTVQRHKLGDKFFLKQTKKPSMLRSEREHLKEIYDTEVRNLEELLGKKLPWGDFRDY